MVEAAIVLPAMTFLILTVMQLTMVQHAKIMTEYAAFCAARAGIVFNADKQAMERAATIALLPTIGRTDTLTAFGLTAIKAISVEKVIRAPFGMDLARVTVLSPKKSDFSASLTRHLNSKEIDFDDIRGIAARPNQLEIELQTFYRMPIPFANQMLQAIFFAQRMDILRFWGRTNPNMLTPDIGGINAKDVARLAYTGSGDPDAFGLVAASYAKQYYFPLKATYTMRMQSNAFQRNAGN